MEKFSPILNQSDKQSEAWLKFKKHLARRLELLREKNDGPHDEHKTSRIRGGIAELKYLISLGEDRPVEPPENELFKD